jgi:hypothetical protein
LAGAEFDAARLTADAKRIGGQIAAGNVIFQQAKKIMVG